MLVSKQKPTDKINRKKPALVNGQVLRTYRWHVQQSLCQQSSEPKENLQYSYMQYDDEKMKQREGGLIYRTAEAGRKGTTSQTTDSSNALGRMAAPSLVCHSNFAIPTTMMMSRIPYMAEEYRLRRSPSVDTLGMQS